MFWCLICFNVFYCCVSLMLSIFVLFNCLLVFSGVLGRVTVESRCSSCGSYRCPLSESASIQWPTSHTCSARIELMKARNAYIRSEHMDAYFDWKFPCFLALLGAQSLAKAWCMNCQFVCPRPSVSPRYHLGTRVDSRKPLLRRPGVPLSWLSDLSDSTSHGSLRS